MRFGVRDQGRAFRPPACRYVFEKFYRVPVRPGRGRARLAIAREIVVAHGGSITCASVPGAGSDFYFLLPGGARLGHPGAGLRG